MNSESDPSKGPNEDPIYEFEGTTGKIDPRIGLSPNRAKDEKLSIEDDNKDNVDSESIDSDEDSKNDQDFSLVYKENDNTEHVEKNNPVSEYPEYTEKSKAVESERIDHEVKDIKTKPEFVEKGLESDPGSEHESESGSEIKHLPNPEEVKNSMKEDKEESKTIQSHEYLQHGLQFVQPYVSNNSINIGYVRLNWMFDNSNLQDTRIEECKDCGALPSKLSKIEAGVWNCEFCGCSNKYKGTAPKEATTLEKYDKKSELGRQSNIILCIDISPSMNRTIPLGHDETRVVIYLQEGDTYVSYWGQLQKAVENLLRNIAVTSPKTIVGFVFFASKIIIVGDGTKKPTEIEDKGGLFSNAKELAAHIKDNLDGHMKVPIANSSSRLTEIIRRMQPSYEGQTALGPALMVSRELLKGSSKGSQILVVTDGGANHGVGSLHDTYRDKSRKNPNPYPARTEAVSDTKFYKNIAEELKKEGITVSIYTFGDDDCFLKDLSILTNETQGLMGRNEIPVDTPKLALPLHMKGIFNIIIKVIGNKKLIINPISDIPSEKINDHSLKQTKELILTNSISYFEFKPTEKLKPWEKVPIQVQLSFYNDNMKMRRTFTDYVIFATNPPERPFTEYDVLIKYGAKVLYYSLRMEREDHRKKVIIERLEKMIKLISNPRKGIRKRNRCVIKLQDKIKTIKSGNIDDTGVTRMEEEITQDCQIQY